ncbi:hypothetical protein [Bosea sp. OK403]|uniref:hypothetical protein n=1 Tax=Bosea sp. OK403 TaxID=1855286 RepID=UPI0011141011|nr:hypothetical protein [Bosea sp. OK403]
MEIDSGRHFGCEACGSPSVDLPSPLTESCVIRCHACGKCITTWREFRERIHAEILKHEGPRSSRVLCADP